jgi:iron-sulfur cluster repair protein YtfE (RIC family)
MNPSEVREMILADHREIRQLLERVEELTAPESGVERLAELRERGRALHDKFIRHLELEDRYLVPAVRDADGWGEERARQITEEHRQQRELLADVLHQLRDATAVPAALRRSLRSFVEAMRADMIHEEKAVLRDDILRDDVVAVNVEAG